MTIANGSRHSMAYVAESSYGTTPATPAFVPVRHKATTLALSKTIFQSDELRSDRQIADLRHGTVQVGGDIQCELSFGAFDDLIAAALCGSWSTNVLIAGTTRHSFTFERKFADIGQYLRYNGCEVGGMHLDVQPGAVVSTAFDIVGRDMQSAQAAISGATYAAASTGRPMDALSGAIKEGGSTLAVVTAVQLDLQNGLQPQFVVGSANTLQPSIGRSNLTGTLTAYFEDASLYAKFIGESESSLELTLSDGDDSYVISVPRIKYTGGQPDVQGEGPVTIAMPVQALLDSATGTNVSIVRSA